MCCELLAGVALSCVLEELATCARLLWHGSLIKVRQGKCGRLALLHCFVICCAVLAPRAWCAGLASRSRWAEKRSSIRRTTCKRFSHSGSLAAHRLEWQPRVAFDLRIDQAVLPCTPPALTRGLPAAPPPPSPPPFPLSPQSHAQWRTGGKKTRAAHPVFVCDLCARMHASFQTLTHARTGPQSLQG